MEQLRAIRAEVFIQEQGVPQSLEWDGLDDDAEHFLALDDNGAALGTARLLKTGQIGRMAVLQTHRSRGIGRHLLNAAVQRASDLGMKQVYLHAQQQAEGFYRGAGFAVEGAPFDEAGISHISMRLILPMPDEAIGQQADTRLVSFDTEHDALAGLLTVLARARRKVAIFNHQLDHALFGTPPCVTLLSKFARQRHTQTRVLVEDPKAVATTGHPILALAHRLPSKVTIRRVPGDRAPPRHCYVVVDEQSVWLQPDGAECIGWTRGHDRATARRLLEEFDWLFERAEDDPELRLLNL